MGYYFKSPGDAAERHFLLLDPTLATGVAPSLLNRLSQTSRRATHSLPLQSGGPDRCETSARRPSGCSLIGSALERELNERGYILAGLINEGDRLSGTR